MTQVLLEQYAPLQTPISAEAVTCTDLVCDETEVQSEEEARLRIKLKELKNNFLSYEQIRLCLEKFLESRKTPGSIEAKKLMLNSMKDAGEVSRSEVKQSCNSLVASIQQYESKRIELSEALATLGILVQEHGDVSMESTSELVKEEEKRICELHAELTSCRDSVSKLDNSISETMAELEQVTKLNDERAEQSISRNEVLMRERVSQMEAELEWVTEFKKVMRGIRGIEISAISDREILVEMPGAKVQFICDPVTGTLEDIVVDDVLEDKLVLPIIKEAKRRCVHPSRYFHSNCFNRQDKRFALREILALVNNHQLVQEEIQALSQDFPVRQVHSEVLVTLPQGVVLTMYIDNEYPMPFSPATIVGIEAFNGMRQPLVAKALDDIRKLCEAQNFFRMYMIVEAVGRYFDSK